MVYYSYERYFDENACIKLYIVMVNLTEGSNVCQFLQVIWSSPKRTNQQNSARKCEKKHCSSSKKRGKIRINQGKVKKKKEKKTLKCLITYHVWNGSRSY